MESVQKIVKEKGMRVSHQRLKILDFLRTYKGHRSARQVYESLLQEMPGLSRTTVYNTLNSLAEKGLIRLVRVPGGESRYEYADHDHCHFFCSSCDTIIDTDLTCKQVRAVESQGHKVQSVQGCFYGVCRACLGTREQGGSSMQV